MALLASHETSNSGLIEFSTDIHDIHSVVSDEYGTFEVSMIEVESEGNGLDGRKLRFNLCARVCYTCSEEFFFVWLLLSAPFHIATYKTLLFHVASFFFSVFSAVCIALLYVSKLPMAISTKCGVRFRHVETLALRYLLQLDCALFNFVSPRVERVEVYDPSVYMQHQGEGLYGMYAQLYFGGIKLICTGVPGAIAAVMFVWSLQNVVTLALQFCSDAEPNDVSTINGHSMSVDHELDMMMIVAIVAIYACVLLMQVFAFISKQFASFFCSQYLLHAGGV